VLNFFRRKVGPPVPDLPVAFGTECGWLTIRSASVLEVALALRLRRTEAANWAGGLQRAYAGDMFVSPAVASWVLAISDHLPKAGRKGSPDRLSPLLVRLSRRFGEAQLFETHRMVEYHAWAKAQHGQIVRAFAYSGETGATLWNIGPQTPEEIALGFNFFDEASPEAASAGSWRRTDLSYPNEESVLAIARRWSVDTSFSGGPYSPDVGVVGVFRS
jgi:hypothetical protein